MVALSLKINDNKYCITNVNINRYKYVAENTITIVLHQTDYQLLVEIIDIQLKRSVYSALEL